MLAIAACLTGLTEKTFFVLGYVNYYYFCTKKKPRFCLLDMFCHLLLLFFFKFFYLFYFYFLNELQRLKGMAFFVKKKCKALESAMYELLKSTNLSFFLYVL